MDGLIQDLRYAAWSLIKAPAFTAIAVLLLALGIGVNTAVFTVLDAVVLRPLPYRDADRIVTVATAPRGGGSPGMTFSQLSIPNFQDLQDRSRSFQSSAFYISRETSVTSGLAAEYVRAARVSPEFFSVFGVEPIFGRLFTGDETAIGSGGAALISEGYWKSHFNGKRPVLGRTIRLYGASVAVVGVLPSTFRLPANTDIWFPADTITTETRQYRGANNYLAVGKLHGGTTLERARAEASRIGDQLSREYGQFNAHQTMTVARMQDDLVKDARPTLYVMFGAVSLILLIACVNVAILLLQRMTVRARDLAIRAALGGSASRLARQILVEMLMLSLLAGSASLVLAVAGTQALIAMAPPDVPRLAEVRVDTTV